MGNKRLIPVIAPLLIKAKRLVMKIRFKLFDRFVYRTIQNKHQIHSMDTVTKKVLVYNPYDDPIMNLWGRIENYQVINRVDKIQPSTFDRVLIGIYFFTFRISRFPHLPEEIVQNKSTFKTNRPSYPILSKEIESVLSADNAKLLLFNPWELIPINASVHFSLNCLFKKYPVLKNKVLLSASDFINSNKIVDYGAFQYIPYNWAFLLARFFSKETPSVSKSTVKTKRFIFLNRRDNAERFVCACYFHTRYPDQCYISYLSKGAAPHLSKWIDAEEGKRFFNKIPMKLDGSYETVDWNSTEGLSGFINIAYLMIIFETNKPYTAGPEIFCQVSEKTFKGIQAGMPFVVFSRKPGIMKSLRRLGFETFSPIIDESYDDDLDYETRYDLLMHEMERICRLSDEEMAALYQKCQPIIEHNTNVLHGAAIPAFL